MKNSKKIIMIFILITMLFVSYSFFTNAYVNTKWGNGFFTENYIYLIDNADYSLFKGSWEGMYITDTEGAELANNDKIFTGAKMMYSATPAFTYIVLGDVNSDGVVTAADARIVLRISADITTETSFLQFLAADINNSYKVESFDARKILRYAAKLDGYDEFSKEKLINYNYMDEAYVTVKVYDSMLKDDGHYTPDMFDSKLVESVLVTDNNSKTSHSLILKLKDPGRDNVDELIYKLMGIPGVYADLPGESDLL